MGEESERGTKATGTDADTSQTADGETNDNAKKAWKYNEFDIARNDTNWKTTLYWFLIDDCTILILNGSGYIYIRRIIQVLYKYIH